MFKYYLGCDVSKGYSDFQFIDKKKQKVGGSFQLDDTHTGHAALYARLKYFFKEHPGVQLHIALESTGGYERNWYASLVKFQSSLPIKVAILNPAQVKSNNDVGHKVTTDAISAYGVAAYMVAHPEKVNFNRQDYFASPKRHWKFLRMLTRQKTQLFNLLESELYMVFPDILTFCKDGYPQWVMKLLKLYPTAARLSRARVSKVAQIPYVNEQRAIELIQEAKQSVACVGDELAEELVRSLVAQIQQFEQQIKLHTQRLKHELNMPEIELLKTFIGIGDYSAIGLMIEIQSIHRFKRSQNLASFFGVHPAFRQSGDGISGFRMSKQGRKEPRRLLFLIAFSASTSNPVIRQHYQMHLAKGMCSMAALGACMHKITRIIFGMLKNNTPFNPAIDQMNRQRQKTRGEKKLSTAQIERIQTFDKTAPISRRQNKKRKEQERLSQKANGIMNGIGCSAPEEINENSSKIANDLTGNVRCDE